MSIKKAYCQYLFLFLTLLFAACENPFMVQILEPKTIVFDSNGGSPVSSQNLFKGQPVKKPADPVRDGYDFTGWYQDNNNFKYEWDFDTIPTGDVTLYAKWLSHEAHEAQLITNVAITITAPVKDEKPDNTADGSGNFTIEEVSWSPAHDLFLGGETYTVYVTIMANEGYTFAEALTATINGEPVSVTPNTENTRTLSYTFAKTDTRTVTNISISSQPSKLEYTHGDTLDLNGLVVTLTFDIDEPEDVALGDFVSRNISTVPTDGTPLVHITHNNTAVTVKYGNHLEVDTNPLTVNPKVIAFTVNEISPQTYTGNPITPPVTVRDGETPLVLGTDYTVKYADNTNEGTATVTITGIGNYEGSSGSATFTIYKDTGAVTHTVTFNTDGGVPAINSISVTEGGKVTKPADPTKPYTLVAGLYLNPLPTKWQFDGWYNGDDEWDFNTPITENITLTANWISPAIDVPTSTVGNNDVEKAIAYLNGLSTANSNTYTLLVDTNVNIAPQTLSTNQNLTIQGLGTERTIQYSSGTANSSLFTINVIGASLTLGENITLKGADNGTASLVRVSSGTLVMEEGSKITGHTNTDDSMNSNKGGGVYVGLGGTFTMNGGTISGNKALDGAGVHVECGKFTMSGSAKISGNTVTNNMGGGVLVIGIDDNSGTFDMTGGAIENNTAISGGGVSVFSPGIFNMSGGTVGGTGQGEGNTAISGGGVYVSGEFTMSGNAKVSGNQAILNDDDEEGNGGGVFVDGGIFTISDNAKVSDNTAEGSGGGVYVGTDSTFTMNGGEVSGNTAESGGGVYVNGHTTIFTMTGGIVGGTGQGESNKADNGGGVCMTAKGTFNMSGGEVLRNEAVYNGGGVLLRYQYPDSGSGNFNMSGSASVLGNTANKGGGVYVDNGSFSMSGSEISGNSTESDGGGVYIGGGTFTMSGGKITENTAGTGAGGGGVYFSDGEFIVGGTAKILGNFQGNTPSKNKDAHLFCDNSGSRYIILGDGNNDVPKPITGTDGMKIYVSINETLAHDGIIVQSGATPEIAECFHADKFGEGVGYRVTANNMGQLYISAVDTVSVAAGVTFFMGSPPDEANRNSDETQHQVKLTQGFFMSKYQVTQAQWQAVMAGNNNEINLTPSSFSSTPANDEIQNRRPVESVSWYDAIVFCNKLSVMEDLSPAYSIVVSGNPTTDPTTWGIVPTNDDATWNAVTIVAGSNGYRLPTEAQWEYACRAGTTTAYNTGNTIENNTGWYYGNSGNMTHEVGKKPANAWGLYDMHGNVWEWCWDWYETYPTTVQDDPTGPSSGTNRVIRGGGWKKDAVGDDDVRSARRGSGIPPTLKGDDVGFRVLRPAP